MRVAENRPRGRIGCVVVYMNAFLPVLSVALAAAGISVAVIYFRLCFDGAGLAVPEQRSLHVHPTPHGGGAGVVAAMLICGYWAGVAPVWLAAIAVLALISWLDDWYHLPFWIRLSVHFFIAVSVVFCHEGIFSLWSVIAVILIVWATNAYNFMDGMDGLAGSMTVAGFTAYAIGLFWHGDFPLAALCVSAAAAAAGFLCFNWHPARIFMGDIGSIPLGLLAGGIGWYGFIVEAWPLWFPVLVFSPFLYDATVTLARRVLQRKRFWEAHREHYYQRMVLLGKTHAAVCRLWLVAMLAIALTALLLLRFTPSGGWCVLFAWLVAMAMFGRSVDVRWAKNK